jgi:hypothetical protein
MNDFGGLFPLVVVAFRAEDRLDGFRERFVFGGESVAEPSGFNRSRPFVPVLTKERIRISLAQKLEEVGRFRFKRSIYSTRECIGKFTYLFRSTFSGNHRFELASPLPICRTDTRTSSAGQLHRRSRRRCK